MPAPNDSKLRALMARTTRLMREELRDFRKIANDNSNGRITRERARRAVDALETALRSQLRWKTNGKDPRKRRAPKSDGWPI